MISLQKSVTFILLENSPSPLLILMKQPAIGEKTWEEPLAKASWEFKPSIQHPSTKWILSTIMCVSLKADPSLGETSGEPLPLINVLTEDL